jgi:hypothetical protein
VFFICFLLTLFLRGGEGEHGATVPLFTAVPEGEGEGEGEEK